MAADRATIAALVRSVATSPSAFPGRPKTAPARWRSAWPPCRFEIGSRLKMAQPRSTNSQRREANWASGQSASAAGLAVELRNGQRDHGVVARTVPGSSEALPSPEMEALTTSIRRTFRIAQANARQATAKETSCHRYAWLSRTSGSSTVVIPRFSRFLRFAPS